MALYHYCPNEAFHSIISNREIRLSSLSLSNDYMEGKLVEKGILKIAEEDRLNMDQMEGLKGALTYISSTADGLGFCLSEKKDLLSQWRGYANDANGVSIGFSKNYLELLSNSLRDDKTPRFTLNQVIYKPDEIASVLNPTYQKIKEHIDKGAFKRPVYPGLLSIRPKEEYEKENKEILKKNSDVFMALVPLIGNLYALKSIAFEEEFEWRLISLLFNIPNMDPEPCLFHPSLNKIKPYRSFKLTDLKVNPIEEIVIGPKNSTPGYVIESFLIQNGFKNVKVISSKATYR